MPNELVKIGILGTSESFEIEDTTARTTADTAVGKAEEALGKFPVSILNGGTGGNTLEIARDNLEVAYDLQVMLGLYEGRDLMEVFAEEIANYTDEAEWFNARVIAGNFTGIRPFDYFDIHLTDGKVFRYRVGAIDPYLHTTDQEVVKHHIIMVPDQVWPDSVQWNTTNTNQGTSTTKCPYLASNLHRWEINTFYPLMPQKWKNVMAEHRLLLEERYSTAGAQTNDTNWSWQNVGKVFSLSEIEVYGFLGWSKLNNTYAAGMDCHFPIFKTTANRIRRNPSDERYSWWLRSVGAGSSSWVCYVSYNGNCDYYDASNTGVRALPCFRVGV